MRRVRLKPVFIVTRNVRNFEAAMDGLALAHGEGRLGLVCGRAGRGKTRTSQWWAAKEGAVYLRVVTVWTELDFLRALCREVGIPQPPKRRGACYAALVDMLSASPRTVILDEIEKMSSRWLDVVRDVSDVTACAVVLVGEEELAGAVRRNRRVWSRIYQQVEFGPITAADVVVYAREAAGLEVSPEAAAEIHQRSGGDFRLVRRDVVALAHVAAAQKTQDVDRKMAQSIEGMHAYGAEKVRVA
ncbi:hypothetical protein SAMN02746041_03293 [Desulfacinum hydrothermale DSM 13146]|uniref:ORC1/DEAH AAA+ ATPase domain-containing protein n=1 Tax=Desulfacinum hydrothermale DSM 13146 TaxID=1121390 RepID=A0A1W1XXL2_9BACT|nr:ATP-binding protein [Desulfacinum hydrothermale]SMC28632.1 hypothetical protein SAMN02746041_03293 [Desulfacinum hydrothermale DSM 13146]